MSKPLLYGYEVDLSGPCEKGRFGRTYHGRNKDEGQVMVKIVSQDLTQGRIKAGDKFNNNKVVDCRILDPRKDPEQGKVLHKNLVHLLGCFFVKETFYLITNQYPLGDLAYFVKKHEVDSFLKNKFMVECSSAVSFLHSFQPPIIHRHITPKNIIIVEENKKYIAKVTDYFYDARFQDYFEDCDSGYVSADTNGNFFETPAFFNSTGGRNRRLNETTFDVFCLGSVFHALVTYPNTGILLIDEHTAGQEIVPIGKQVKDDTKFGDIFSESFITSHHERALAEAVFGMLSFHPCDRLTMEQAYWTFQTIFNREDDKKMKSFINSNASTGVNKIAGYNVNMSDCLGVGDFGTTFKATYCDTQTIAIKQLRSHIDTDKMNLLKVKHTNINPVVQSFLDGKHQWLLMEMCEFNLQMYMQSHFVNLGDRLNLMEHCATGLAYLHGKKLAWGNIKPANVLVKKSGDQYVAKIADTILVNAYKSTSQYNKTFNQSVETIYFYAPEYFNQVAGSDSADDRKYICEDSRFDVFSLGLLFTALLQYDNSTEEMLVTGFDINNPVGKQMAECMVTNTQTQEVVTFTTFSEEPKADVKQILKQMVQAEISSRPNMEDICTTLDRFTAGTRKIQHKEVKTKMQKKEYALLKEDDEDERETLDMLTNKFSEQLGRELPPYFQYFSPSDKYFRINVSIDKGLKALAQAYIKKKCNSKMVKLIHFTEQRHRPELIAQREHEGVKRYVQPGSILSISNNTLQDRPLGYPTFEDAVRRANCDFRYGTLGCFAQDENGKKYGVTVKHIFDENVGTTDEVCSTYSAYQLNNGPNSYSSFPVKLSDRFLGLYGGNVINNQSKLIDIAVLPMERNISPNIRLNIEDIPGRKDLKLYHDHGLPDQNMRRKRVEMNAAKSGHVNGIVSRTNIRLPIYNQVYGGVFSVKPLHNGRFANHGDSGSVIYETPTDTQKVPALGMVYMKQDDHRDEDDSSMDESDDDSNFNIGGNIAFCVRLDHGLQSIQEAFNINLRICNQEERSWLTVLVLTSVLILLLAVMINYLF